MDNHERNEGGCGDTPSFSQNLLDYVMVSVLWSGSLLLTDERLLTLTVSAQLAAPFVCHDYLFCGIAGRWP